MALKHTKPDCFDTQERIKPDCFDTQEQWNNYVQQASCDPDFEPTLENMQFCNDCTADYRARMVREKRCARAATRGWWRITLLRDPEGSPTGRARIEHVALSHTPIEHERITRFFPTREAAATALNNIGWVEE